MENNSFEEIWDRIRSSKNIAMTLHYGPDGDSLGSCTAMKYVIERNLEAKVKLVSSDSLDDQLKKFEFSREVEFGIDISDLNPKDYDTFLSLDCGSVTMISGKLKDSYKLPESYTINIDHHDTNNYYGNLNYVNPKSSSTCSILVDLFKNLKIDINEELATRLELGVYTDSIAFTVSNDMQKTFEDTAFLISKGARYNEIVENILTNTPLKMKKYYGILFNNLVVEENYAYSFIGKEDVEKLNLNSSDIRKGSMQLVGTDGRKLIFLLAEMNGYIRGSFRSKDKISSASLAKLFGGGGHKYASGFNLEGVSLEDAIKKVAQKIEDSKSF